MLIKNVHSWIYICRNKTQGWIFDEMGNLTSLYSVALKLVENHTLAWNNSTIQQILVHSCRLISHLCWLYIGRWIAGYLFIPDAEVNQFVECLRVDIKQKLSRCSMIWNSSPKGISAFSRFSSYRPINWNRPTSSSHSCDSPLGSYFLHFLMKLLLRCKRKAIEFILVLNEQTSVDFFLNRLDEEWREVKHAPIRERIVGIALFVWDSKCPRFEMSDAIVFFLSFSRLSLQLSRLSL